MVNYILECEGETRQGAEERSLEILQLKPEDIEFEAVNTGVLKRIFKNSPVLLRSLPLSKDIPQESLARGIVYTLLSKLNIKAEIQDITEKDGNLYMDIDSEQSAQIIGRHGRNLDSLQFLLNLLVAKWTQQKKRIILDVSDYRKKRRKTINLLCEKVADKVARSQRAITLNYMSPYERRIVHLFLEDDEDVYTESIGKGTYKRVQVLPYRRKNSKKRGVHYSEEEEYHYENEGESEEDDNFGNYRDDDDDSEYEASKPDTAIEEDKDEES